MPLSELSTASAAHRFPAASAPAASAPAAQASVPVLADHPEFGPAAATGAPGQGWVHEPVEAPSRRSGGRRAAAAAAGPMAAGPMAAGQLAVGPVGASAAGVRPPVQGGPSPVSGPIRLTDSPAEPLFPLLSPGPSAPLGGTPAPFGPRDATGPLAVVVDLRTVPQPVISTGPRSREAVDALAYAAIRSAGAGLHPAGDSGPSTGSLLVVGAGASVTPHLAATRAAGRSQPGRHQA